MENKKELVITKSKYEDDYVLFLHNEIKHGDCWKQIIRGTYKRCLNIKRYMENEKMLQF